MRIVVSINLSLFSITDANGCSELFPDFIKVQELWQPNTVVLFCLNSDTFGWEATLFCDLGWLTYNHNDVILAAKGSTAFKDQLFYSENARVEKSKMVAFGLILSGSIVSISFRSPGPHMIRFFLRFFSFIKIICKTSMRQNTDLVSGVSTGYGHKCQAVAMKPLFLLHIKMGGALVAPFWHPTSFSFTLTCRYLWLVYTFMFIYVNK